MASEKEHKKREFILRELVDTEAKFVRHMNEVVDHYMAPLEDAARDPKKGHILKPEYIQTSFSVIRQILNLSIPFLEDLRKIDPTDPNFSVGKVMKPIVPYYKLYKVYAGNHSKAMSTIERCSTTKPKFQKFLQDVKKRSDSSGESLHSLLIMPIQRLLRLKMLLERLLKFTTNTHCDYDDLTSCLQAVRDVADHVNHGVTEKENRIKVWEVQQRMVPPPPDLVKPHRTFVREGKLLKVCRRTDKARHFFLFNDILVYGPSLTGNLINYSNSIALRRVMDLKRQKGGCAFAVFGIPKSFVLIASSRAEKKAWMNDLYRLCDKIEAGAARRRKTIKEEDGDDDGDDKNEEKCGDDDFVTIQDDFEINGAPLWVPDNFSNACMCCGVVKFSKFSLRNRRHHCRMCGVLVCGSCSKGKLMLPHVNRKKPVRVCDKCKARVNKEDEKDDDHVDENEDDNVVEDDFVMIENMNSQEQDSSDDDMKQVVLSSDEEAETDHYHQQHRPSQVSDVKRVHNNGDNISKENVIMPMGSIESEIHTLQALETAKRKRSMRLSQHIPDTATLLTAPTITASMSSSADPLMTYRPADAAVPSVPVVNEISDSRRDSLRHNRPAPKHRIVSGGSKYVPSLPTRSRVVSNNPGMLVQSDDDEEEEHDDVCVRPGKAHSTMPLSFSSKYVPSSPSKNHRVVSQVPTVLSDEYDSMHSPEIQEGFLPGKAHTTSMKEDVHLSSAVRPTRSLSDAPDRLIHESSSSARRSVRLSVGLPAQIGSIDMEAKLGVSEASKPSSMIRKASKSCRKRRMNEKRERNRVERQMAKWMKAPESPSSEYAHLAKTVAHQDTHRARPPGGRRPRRGRRGLISKVRNQI